MRPLVLLLLPALVLAGCADVGGPAGEGAPDVSTMTTAEARSFVERAGREMPDRFGMEMSISKGGAEGLVVNGVFDNASGVFYLEMRGDASALGEEVDDSARAFFEQGIAMYVSPEGSLYLANGTAFTFPATDDDGDDSDGFVPAPDEGPFGQLLDPTGEFLGDDQDLVVKSVTPATLRGKPAARMEVTITDDDNETMDATLHVFTSPARLGRIEATMPADDPDEPFSGADLVTDLYYDDDVKLAISDAAKRALALRYQSDANPFDFGGGGGPVTWTFNGTGGIALGEVEAHVKGAGDQQSAESGPDVAALPTLWTMRLSEGTKTQDGVTMTFTDVDGDGKVSKGDTLRIEGPEDAPPTVVLYDTVTSTYVVPGPGVFALLGLVALAALAARRK